VPLFSFDTAQFLIDTSRLELVFPLVGSGLVAAAAALIRRRSKCEAPVQAAALVAAILVFVGLALVVGRAQHISFYRYSSFALAVTIAFSVLLWGIPRAEPDEWFSRIARDKFTPIVMVVASLVVAVHLTRPFTAFANAWRFATGVYSIDRAYESQFGPTPRLSWSAIHPGARGAYGVVGPRTRIWSLHVHTYCMLPDCRIETVTSFIMTRRWDQVMFGSAEQGRQTLQADGLNYFLFSRENDIRDPLPASALFKPDNIAKHLGIRWTDGTTTLLTWLGPDTVPLDSTWLANYRRAVESSGAVASFPYSDLQSIFARLNATPHPWRSFRLPWQGN